MPDTVKDHTALLLQTTTTLMRPLARLLVAQGVTYTLFAKAMKRVFLDAAQDELESAGKRVTDSALSLLSGVHRKDVRVLTSEAPPPPKTVTLASQVITAWTTQPEYLDADGRPLALPLRAVGDSSLSFEQLSQGISKDFHARSVLDELARLGVVREADGQVQLVDGGFVPTADLTEFARNFAGNAADHLAAASANFTAARAGLQPPYIEFSLWGDELSRASVEELQRLSRQQWLSAMKKVRSLAEKLSAEERDLPPQAEHRFRFGVYFYHCRGTEPTAPTEAAALPPPASHGAE